MSQEVEKHLTKCLRLFLSVDLVGSTSFKNRSDVEKWLKVFFEFFRDFPVSLSKRYESDDSVPCPKLWKTLGDEIVFVVELTKRAAALTHIIRFREALRSYREVLKNADPILDLKATMWMAGFPVGNSLVFIPDDSRNEEVEDYIGPNMDIGFRLKEAADPRRMVVSLELALLIAYRPIPEALALNLYLSEGKSFKGVIGGRDYPVFWTNMYDPQGDELELQADNLRGCSPDSLHWETTKKYCEHFIQQNGPPLFIPFIPTDPDFSFKSVDYDEEYLRIQKIWGNTIYAENGEMPAESEDPLEKPKVDLNELLQKMLKQGEDSELDA